MKRFASIFDLLSRRMIIVLAVQVVLCLSLAPILSAQQWVAQSQKDPTAKQRRATIQAGFDASSVRPEEVSDTERTRSKKTTGVVTSVTMSSPSASFAACSTSAPSPLYSGERAGVRGRVSFANTALNTAPHPALSSEYRGEGKTLSVSGFATESVRTSDAVKFHRHLVHLKFEIENRPTPHQAIPALQPAAPPMI